MARGMCKADVTSSQWSPGLGAIKRLVKTAFSAVLRDCVSIVIRSRGHPRVSKNDTAKLASDGPEKRLALPPENTMRADGYLRASSTATVTRSAASSSDIWPRAADLSGLIATTRQMMQVDAPCEG